MILNVIIPDLEEGAKVADAVAPKSQLTLELGPVVKQVLEQKEEQRGEPSGGETTQQEASFFQWTVSDMVPWAISHGSDKEFAALFKAPPRRTLSHVAKILLEFAPCLIRASSELTNAQSRAVEVDAARKRAAEVKTQIEAIVTRLNIMVSDLGLAKKVAEDAKAKCTHVASLLKEAQEESR